LKLLLVDGETGIGLFKLFGVFVDKGVTVVVVIVDGRLLLNGVIWPLFEGDSERFSIRGCLMEAVVDLAAGVGVSLKICGLLRFNEATELLIDEGGDGEELRTEFGVALNCDLIALKFLLVVVTVDFFVTELTRTRPGEDEADDDTFVGVGVCCFCSKIEIRSEIGVFPDCVNRVAILIVFLVCFIRLSSIRTDEINLAYLFSLWAIGRDKTGFVTFVL
jgi:hypothetical protein